MKFQNITAKNFLSFRELKYDFQDHPVLIQGENLTDDNQESNGSGKSAIQAAIEYCLFKTTSRKVTDNKLVQFGETESYLSLSIYCPIREQILMVERKIRKKGGNSSQVSVNGVVKHSFEDKVASEIDKFIIGWIGIEKIDLQNYFIVNKERFKSIFSSSNREKMELINRFSNAKLINGVDGLVKEKVRELESELRTLTRKRDELIGSVKMIHQEKKEELNRDIEKEIKDIINHLDGKINTLKGNALDYKMKLNSFKSKISEKVSEIEKLTAKDEKVNNLFEKLHSYDIDSGIDSLVSKKDELSVKRNKIHRHKNVDVKELNDLNKILREVKTNLAGSIVCPKCSHEFIPGDENVDIEEERKSLEEVSKFISIYESRIKDYESDLRNIEELDYSLQKGIERKQSFSVRWGNRINSIKRSISNSLNTVSRQLNSLKNDQENTVHEIERIGKAIKAYEQDKKDAVNLSIDEDRIVNLNQKLKDYGKKLKDYNDKIVLKDDEIFRTGQWVTNFTKFNMFLANQSLKVIQGYCNKFLVDLKSDMQVKWEGVKILANGKKKEEISSYILRDNEVRDFWSFSGGERARLEYAMIFTLQEMINRTHKFGGLDFLSADEISEGLDSQGLSDLMSSLSGMNKSVLITTHVVNKNVGGEILLVRKENGVSKIY